MPAGIVNSCWPGDTGISWWSKHNVRYSVGWTTDFRTAWRKDGWFEIENAREANYAEWSGSRGTKDN